MTTTDLAVRQPPTVPTTGELEEIKETVRTIAATEFVPKGMRGNPHAVLACILYGREIGLGPMESLQQVHMIDGRPSLSAAGKLKRAREAGHSIVGEVKDGVATVTGRRADNGDEHTASFSLEDAKAAGLLGKSNWKQWPDDMLWARAVARLCRRLFDDVPGALYLDPDEAELSEAQRVEEITDLGPPEDAAPGIQTDLSSEAAPEGNDGETGAVEVVIVDEGQTAFPIPEAVRQGFEDRN